MRDPLKRSVVRKIRDRVADFVDSLTRSEENSKGSPFDRFSDQELVPIKMAAYLLVRDVDEVMVLIEDGVLPTEDLENRAGRTVTVVRIGEVRRIHELLNAGIEGGDGSAPSDCD